MTIAIYPGSFDPMTNGHIDIIKKGAKIFDKIIVAITYNSQKTGFLPIEIRKKLVEECVKDVPNIQVDTFEGLTVEYASKKKANVIIRGIRNTLDFEYERQLAQNNNMLKENIETVFLISNPKYSFISSSGIKEILANNGDVTKFVPLPVAEFLKNN